MLCSECMLQKFSDLFQLFRYYSATLHDSTGISEIILVKVGHEFSNKCYSICVNHLLNIKICQTVLYSYFIFPTLCSNAEGFLCMPCVGVFREIVTHKKGVGKPIVRTEEIVIRRTFSNP
jgi:hypothetical protein